MHPVGTPPAPTSMPLGKLNNFEKCLNVAQVLRPIKEACSKSLTEQAIFPVLGVFAVYRARKGETKWTDQRKNPPPSFQNSGSIKPAIKRETVNSFSSDHAQFLRVLRLRRHHAQSEVPQGFLKTYFLPSLPPTRLMVWCLLNHICYSLPETRSLSQPSVPETSLLNRSLKGPNLWLTGLSGIREGAKRCCQDT